MPRTRIRWQNDRVTETSAPEGQGATDLEERLEVGRPWTIVVWNDPVNLMSYVAWVFRSYFGYPAEHADMLMLTVHEQGRATVATGPREEMERHVIAMHGFGLWATLERAGT